MYSVHVHLCKQYTALYVYIHVDVSTSSSRSLRTIIENCQCSQHTNCRIIHTSIHTYIHDTESGCSWCNGHTAHLNMYTHSYYMLLTPRNCAVSSIVLLSSIIFLVNVVLCWVLDGEEMARNINIQWRIYRYTCTSHYSTKAGIYISQNIIHVGTYMCICIRTSFSHRASCGGHLVKEETAQDQQTDYGEDLDPGGWEEDHISWI